MELVCRNRRELLECPATSTAVATSSASIQSTYIISSSSSTPSFTPVSPTNNQVFGLPFPLLIAIPVGGTVLLIVLVLLLVMSLLCLKYRKTLCKRRTDEGMLAI